MTTEQRLAAIEGRANNTSEAQCHIKADCLWLLSLVRRHREALKALHERYVMAIGNEGPEALTARALLDE